jgi:hypothetical protein
MSWVGFELTIPVFDQAKNLRAGRCDPHFPVTMIQIWFTWTVEHWSLFQGTAFLCFFFVCVNIFKDSINGSSITDTVAFRLEPE